MGKKKKIVKEVGKTGIPTKILQTIVRNYRKIFPNATVKEALDKAGVSGAESIKKGTGKVVKRGAIGTGVLDVGHYGITGESYIGKKLRGKSKGGYVKMNKGGSVNKSSSYKKSRGTGAAKSGTKFKGVF